MGLNASRQNLFALRNAVFAFTVLAFFAFSGCGGGEEATQQEGSTEAADTAAAQPYDQALTSFVGGEPAAQSQNTEDTTAQQQAQPQVDETQKQIDALKTDNTDLRQKNLKLEDDVQKLTARLNDAEAKYAAEKERADSAEEAAKMAAAAVAAQPMTETKKTESMETAMKTEIPMAEYEDALSVFKSKKYDDAANAFQKMIDSGAPEEIADNCHYWIGEAKYGSRKYKDAVQEFETVLKYKRSEKKGDAQFMIAQCYERMGNKVKAKEAFEKVVKDYPMNRNVKKAKERWARL
jgi:tol-pal system protein YbgF